MSDDLDLIPHVRESCSAEADRYGLDADALLHLGYHYAPAPVDTDLRDRGVQVMRRDYGAAPAPLASARQRVRPLWPALFFVLVAAAAPFVWRWFGWL